MRFNIRDLFSELDPEKYEEIHIKNNTDIEPNLTNIKKGVLEKISEKTPSNNTRRRKKLIGSFNGLWAAVLVICLTATTVFALNSNLDFFKEIFGKDIEKMEKDIQDVVATAENEDFIFTVESLLTDGSQNYFIISLERKDGEEIGDIKPSIHPREIMRNSKDRSEQLGSISVLGVEKIESPDSNKNKGYYLLKYNTTDNLIGEKMKLSITGTYEKSMTKDVSKFDKELSVSFDISDSGNLKTLDMEKPQLIEDKYHITEVKYSNLGINIEGEYIVDMDNIPLIKVKFKYKDGSVKEVSRELVDSDEFGFAYSWGEDKFKNMITFKKPIYFDEIESIIIEGKEYKIY